MRFVLLTYALCATVAACGGSDHPAQDPSSVTASPGTTAASASGTSGDSTMSVQGTAGGGSTSTGDTSPSATSPSTMGTSTTTTAPGTMGSATGSTMTNTPSGSGPTPNADNTGINTRDRRDTLTPLNQGNSSAEIKVTATIRRGLMSDKSLSFTAKNVKVITVGTKVTLRGPVNSDAEKASIEARARQTPGVTDVDDQLDVKK